MKYILTGNRGLIGTFLKKRLDSEGHQCVLAIDRREGFDVCDLLFNDMDIKADVFFHFAAQCKISQAIAEPILPHKNNVDGVYSVLEFCKKHNIPKIVFASSSRVLSPERNPYVASKIYGEEMVKAYSDCYGIEYIIVRPSTVYGPMFDTTSRLINNWLTSAFKDEDLRLYGDENKTLDFTYIDDFVDAIMLTINNDWNKEYNISGNNEMNLFRLGEYIIKEVRSKSKIKILPQETSQPQQVSIDIKDITMLGFQPKFGINDGIEKMIEFYRDNPDCWKNYKDKGEKYYGMEKV